MNALAPRIVSGVAALAATVLFAPQADAAPSAAPNIAIVKVEKAETAHKNDPGASDQPTIKSTGNTTISTRKTTDKGDVTYKIVLHNFSNAPVKGLVVDYRIYNITRNSNNPTDTAVISEVRALESVDIEAGKDFELVTKPVPFEWIQTQTTTTSSYGYTAVANQGGAPNSLTLTPNNITTTSSSSTVSTAVLGWQVDLRLAGKTIKSSDEPGDLMEKLKNVYHYKPQP